MLSCLSGGFQGQPDRAVFEVGGGRWQPDLKYPHLVIRSRQPGNSMGEDSYCNYEQFTGSHVVGLVKPSVENRIVSLKKILPLSRKICKYQKYKINKNIRILN